MAQAVRCSPPTARIPCSRLDLSIVFRGRGNESLARILSGFLPFSPATNFIPPFLHTIHFISSVRQA